jgi:cytochrome c-type biogenesis protein CcmF
MTPLYAEYCLGGAMLTCVAAIVAMIAYLATRNAGILSALRYSLGLVAVFLILSSDGLLEALLSNNFSIAYVVQHSEKTLPAMYKIAAFWAGQEGSLLFWALALALMALVMVFRGRKQNDSAQAISLGTMAIIIGFFCLIMLCAGNPFDTVTGHITNGHGLNPMLQNFAMVAHPPILFLGYAGFAAPFALLLGSLFAGRSDSAWLREARPWMVYSWIMLTVGIVLGAEWAYVELGWGGYWAWDPVENASILPWFTATALLHSAVLQINRGMFKRWTASLTATSFFLCIFGTYLTRSGVIQSVHGFGESPIGTFFLVFLGLTAVVSFIAILCRLDLLRAEHPMTDLFSREGFFLVANVLLSVMTITTLVGTIYPLLRTWIGKTPITVNAPYYNNVVLPMALLLAGLMTLAPMLGQGAGAGRRAAPKLIAVMAAMVLATLVTAAITAAYQCLSLWSIAAAAIATGTITAIAIDMVATLRSPTERPFFERCISALVVRHRHWGAQLAHLGLAAIIVGVTGSSVYSVKDHVSLFPATESRPATTAKVGDYTLTLTKLDAVTRPNHNAAIATIVARDSSGKTFTLLPEKRRYRADMPDEQTISEVAIRYTLASDVYLTFEGFDDTGEGITLGAYVNPLVSWIWIGGALLTLGGLICMIPSRRPDPAAAIEPEPGFEVVMPDAGRAGRSAQKRSPLAPRSSR